MHSINKSSKNINLHHFQIVENEILYGPNKRLLLTYRGCSLRCKGCINKHLWSFKKENEININVIIKMVQNNKLDGLTLYGGEPLDQANSTLNIVKAMKVMNKTIVLFTGYDFNELNYIQKQIWNKSDIVIAGRFILNRKKSNLQFRGSTNQKIFLHKGKYRNYKIKDNITSSILTIKNDGEMIANGFLTKDIKRLVYSK